jgi:U3 small nucleolar RNA-associated protein 12
VFNERHSLFCTFLAFQVAKFIHPVSTFPLSSRHRVSQISFHPKQPYLAVQSHDRSVEIFWIRTEEEIRKKQLRRMKRVKEKKQQKLQDLAHDKQGDENTDINQQDADQDIKLVDQFTPYLIIRTSGKIRSFDFGPGDGSVKGGVQVQKLSFCLASVINIHLQLCVALACNAVEVYTIPQPTKSTDAPEAARIYSVDLPGHRTDVRTLSLSSDDQILASASNGELRHSSIVLIISDNAS